MNTKLAYKVAREVKAAFNRIRLHKPRIELEGGLELKKDSGWCFGAISYSGWPPTERDVASSEPFHYAMSLGVPLTSPIFTRLLGQPLPPLTWGAAQEFMEAMIIPAQALLDERIFKVVIDSSTKDMAEWLSDDLIDLRELGGWHFEKLEMYAVSTSNRWRVQPDDWHFGLKGAFSAQVIKEIIRKVSK